MSFRINLAPMPSTAASSIFGESVFAKATARRIPTVQCEGLIQNRAELDALVEGLTAAGNALWPKSKGLAVERADRGL